jgi:hypothetical protein
MSQAGIPVYKRVSRVTAVHKKLCENPKSHEMRHECVMRAVGRCYRDLCTARERSSPCMRHVVSLVFIIPIVTTASTEVPMNHAVMPITGEETFAVARADVIAGTHRGVCSPAFLEPGGFVHHVKSISVASSRLRGRNSVGHCWPST